MVQICPSCKRTIQEEDSDLYAWLINRAEELVSDAVDSSFEEELNDAS